MVPKRLRFFTTIKILKILQSRKIKIFKLSLRISRKSENIVKKSNLHFLQKWYSETLELFSPPNRTESNRTELNMASWDPNFFNISMFFRVRFDRTELCFIAFEWFYMIYLMHFNDFYEFGSIELIRLNSIRFGSIRFDSVRFDIPGKF